MNAIERLRKCFKRPAVYQEDVICNIRTEFGVEHLTTVRDIWLAVIDEIEEELARDYVELPKDKDGIPIRPDDEIVVHHQGMEPVYSTVTALILTDRWDFEQTCYDTDSRDVNDLSDFYEDVRHVQPDSWEKIELDAKKWMYENGTMNGVMKLIERCKRLADAE